MPGFLGDLAEDEAVGGGDDEQRQAIESDDVEEVVGQLMHGGREEVEGHALCEPPVCRVAFHVEYHALYKRTKTKRLLSVKGDITLCATQHKFNAYHW